MTRNAVINIFGQGIPLLVGVLTAPTIVRGLGSDRYGILAMALAVLGYFSLFDLGLGRAATRFVAAALGEGSDHKVPEIVWTAVVVQLLVGLLGTIVLVLSTPFLVEKILSIQPQLWQEARTTFYILALSIPAILASGSLRGVLEASQRFDLINAVASPMSTANFLLPFIAVLLGWSLPAIVAVLLASRTIGLVLFYRLAVRVFPTVRVIPSLRLNEIRSLLAFGGWITVSSIVSPALVYADRFLLGVLTSMAAVAYYAAPYEVITRLLIVPFSIAAILFPAFSELHQQGNTGAIGILVATSMKFLLFAFAPLVVVLLAFSGDILGLWLGSDFAQHSQRAMQILTVGVLSNAMAQLPHALIQGAGRPDVTARIHMIEVPVQIAVAWVFVGFWGITGAALAWSFRTTFDCALLTVAASRTTSFSRSALVTAKVPQVFLCIALLAGISLASNILLPSPLLRGAITGLSLIIAGLVSWFHLLSAVDRTRVREVLAYRQQIN